MARRPRSAAFAAALTTVVGMCVTAGTTASAAPAQPIRIVVTPASSVVDVSLGIQVAGLRPGQRATVKVASTDVIKGVEWTSQATFVADRQGVIDPSRLAPRAGSYSGVEPMGLIDSMSAPPSETSGFVYYWGTSPSLFRFTVSAGGRVVASTNVQRSLLPPEPKLRQRDFSMADDGFVGRYSAPAPGAEPHPAVLVFGGSDGGLGGGLQAASLAARGFPTLNIAYFKGPGLPATLSKIPLEYFAGALQWLAAQPGVDPSRVWVMGASRGGEAALLLGATYPDLVYGVAALVPSNVVHCSSLCEGSSWTLGGQDVPFTRLVRQSNPTDVPESVIPVERIRGPVLTLCGGADQIWPSCEYADAVAARLQAGAHDQPHRFLAYPDAGHGIAMLIPHEPARALTSTEGTSPAANWHARDQAWPLVLDFLANPT